jgi:hypothetical protein
MRLKPVPYILGAVMLALLAYGLLRRAADPPHVVETGSIALTDRTGTRLILAKRVVEAGGVTLTEVLLPGQGWLDCRGDCRDAVLQARAGAWERLLLK